MKMKKKKNGEVNINIFFQTKNKMTIIIKTRNRNKFHGKELEKMAINNRGLKKMKKTFYRARKDHRENGDGE